MNTQGRDPRGRGGQGGQGEQCPQACAALPVGGALGQVGQALQPRAGRLPGAVGARGQVLADDQPRGQRVWGPQPGDQALISDLVSSCMRTHCPGPPFCTVFILNSRRQLNCLGQRREPTPCRRLGAARALPRRQRRCVVQRRLSLTSYVRESTLSLQILRKRAAASNKENEDKEARRAKLRGRRVSFAPQDELETMHLYQKV